MASRNTPSLGLYGYFGYRIPFPERLTMIAEAGFTHTSFWWPDNSPEIRRLRHDAPPAARDVGLVVDSLHAPYARVAELWSSDEPIRAAVLDTHREVLEDCAAHGIPRLVMHVALGPATPDPSEAAFAGLVARAESLGITICIENTRSPRHARALLEWIDSPALALCFDSSHDLLYGDEPLALLNDWAHRTDAVHLNDTDGRRDYHWLPGAGRVDFDAIRQRLCAAEFAGPWMLEVVGDRRIETAREFLDRAFACATELTRAVPALSA